MRSAERRGSLRLRLAVGMTALALGVAALVALGAAALAAWRGPDPEARTVTRLEQFDDRVVVVQVQEDPQGAAAAEAARESGLRWLLVALGASFVPAAALAWFAAGRVLAPVARVTDLAEAVEGPGSGERVGPVGRDDELGRLATGFDAMLDRLDEREQAQRRLLQEVVHELRTPLAVATTNLELDGPEHVAAAQRALERMSRTVDDLARHGRLHVDAGGDEVDLAAEARGLAAEHQGPALRRGLRVDVAAAAPVPVVADRVGVRTAVGNLLANAVRLAPTGTCVVVDAGTRAGWAWVGVRDEGPGIAPADHAAVFERHWQGRYDRERGRDGGLGLTIARQVTEAQGGHVTVTSAEGEGSSFVVWLPLGTDARTDDVVAPDGVHPVCEPLAAPSPA
jgi:signal transduction histidine kinase